MADTARRGGKRHRKWGRKTRGGRQAFKRYWARQYGVVDGVREEFPNRRALHKARARARFEYMVLESRERKAADSR